MHEVDKKIIENNDLMNKESFKHLKDSLIKVSTIDGKEEFRVDTIDYIDTTAGIEDDMYFYDMLEFVRFLNPNSEAVAYTTPDCLIYLNAPGVVGEKMRVWDFIYCHECLHQLWDTFGVAEELKQRGIEYNHTLLNIASDCVINDYLKRARKKTPFDEGIFPETLEKEFGIVYNYKEDTQYSLYLKLLEVYNEKKNKMEDFIEKNKDILDGPSQNSDSNSGQSGQSGQSGSKQKSGNSSNSSSSKDNDSENKETDNDKDLTSKDAQEAADKAKEAADKAQEAADKAKERASKDKTSESKEAADKAQEAADKAKDAADKAQEAADKAQEEADNGDSDGENKHAKEAQDAAKEAQEATGESQNNSGKEGDNGDNDGGNGSGHSDKNTEIESSEYEDLDKIRERAKTIINKYKERLSGNLSDFIKKCKSSKGLKKDGLKVTVNRGSFRWNEEMNNIVNAYVKQKVNKKKRLYKSTYSRVRRGSGFVEMGKPIKPGRKPKDDLLLIDIAFYIDISGSMSSCINKVFDATYYICEALKSKYKREQVVSGTEFELFGFNDYIHKIKFGDVARANGGTMDFDKLINNIGKHTKEYMINIVITDGEFSVNQSEMKKFIDELDGMILYISNQKNSSSELISKLSKTKEYEDKLYFIEADKDFTVK